MKGSILIRGQSIISVNIMDESEGQINNYRGVIDGDEGGSIISASIIGGGGPNQ
jgi:hypothetical protein